MSSILRKPGDTELLIGVSILSQLVGFGYRVALSRTVGAEVMGLYQLVMPVYSVLLSLSAVGLTSAVSNLTSRHLAVGSADDARKTLRRAVRWFLLLMLPIALTVIPASDFISVVFLGDARTRLGIILLVPCTLLTGIENLHKHFFYGGGMVRGSALVELAEQLVRAGAVLGLLVCFLPQYPERAVGLIVCGMIVCEIFSSAALVLLFARWRKRNPTVLRTVSSGSSGRQLAAIALPVGANALLNNLLSAAVSSLTPQMLVQGGMEPSLAISQLGVVCGMTMPMLALPTVVLGAWNLILFPRITRAHALGQRRQVQRLIELALGRSALFILPCMAFFSVAGTEVAGLMFSRPQAGQFLLPLAAVMAMSCWCSILAGALNATGGQRSVAAVSVLGGLLQLVCIRLLIPLPGVGMKGYVAGAVLSAGFETLLLLRLVRGRTGLRLRVVPVLFSPALSVALSASLGRLLLTFLQRSGYPSLVRVLCTGGLFGAAYLSALQAQGVFSRERHDSTRK